MSLLEEVLVEARQGLKIRRESWKTDRWCTFDKKSHLRWQDGTAQPVPAVDIFATDWVIAQAPKRKFTAPFEVSAMSLTAKNISLNKGQYIALVNGNYDEVIVVYTDSNTGVRTILNRYTKEAVIAAWNTPSQIIRKEDTWRILVP
jgi:hypothetical protein